MRRPQFTLRALLVLIFGAACFFGGIHFESERRRRADEAMTPRFPTAGFQLALPQVVDESDAQ
ncbi:MAG TPA: hypothetical protein VG826_03185 [Pirellulales bacterium]|nr:hypothetical protein [Pirellulales bacterium]